MYILSLVLGRFLLFVFFDAQKLFCYYTVVEINGTLVS